MFAYLSTPLYKGIKPIPSLYLKVKFGSLKFTITLDGGATVSFVSAKLAYSLGLPIGPNHQLAKLADSRFSVYSLGEVDFCTKELSTGAPLRMRALVMDNLAVDCYGGTTFQYDNYIVPDIVKSTVSLHGGQYSVQLPVKGLPPRRLPPMSNLELPASPPSPKPETFQNDPARARCPPSASTIPPQPPSACSVVMKQAKSLLPSGTYAIGLPSPSQDCSVLVYPPTPSPTDTNEKSWTPQICQVVSGSAIYINRTDRALCHQKGAHFRIIPQAPVSEASPSTASTTLSAASAAASLPTPSSSEALSKIKINVDVLTPEQLKRLQNLHQLHSSAFDEDMRGGFKDPESPYRAKFSFKQEHKAPPFKIWVPQFNKTCVDLQQAMCDKLEAEGVLVDPAKCNIDIRHVSPSFITQKARAKHKPLEQCSLSEVRFITCCNVLNDSIHPIAGRSNGYNDILTFLARWKYLIFADLSNSYFQIKIAPAQLKYMGIMTPHRGIRVNTRLSQGLLNSDVHLDQVMGRVLGDEKAAGFCCVARDDLHIGGNTIDECIANWETVLAKLDAHNLKLSPSKVRILLQDSEVFGHRVVDGTIRPSDHIVSTLGSTKIGDLVTVKQINSWKGLYKTLIRHLPHLASFMDPFDNACKNLSSSATFDWNQPGMVAAFNAATTHLDQVRATYLPRPDEQLALQPDASTSNHCAGWVLYTQRAKKWLPVQYMSGKLALYMHQWYPCEKEAVGAVMAIDQCRHWINESKLPTWVLPDSKPVVDAANLMRIGRHSSNPRLQQLLTCVNKSNLVFKHSSAKAGHHAVPDALSRVQRSACTSKDCQIERFLVDMPGEVQFMPISLASLTLSGLDPATLASFAPDISRLLSPGSGPIPLGSRQTWINLQSQCNLSTRFRDCKAQGQIPNSQAKDKAGLNRLFKVCDLDRGLIVSKTFDSILMREISRVFVPPEFLLSVLTIMHVRLLHPLPSQLFKIFERYFVAFNTKNTCDAISATCSLCIACKKFPAQLDNFSPSPSPTHPGTHMNADVLRRAGQHIMVNVDRFSNFATATFSDSESRDATAKALLHVITPMRHNSRVQVRVDRARALLSLAQTPDKQLTDNGIELDLGDKANRNSNAAIDKIHQELEAELIKLDPSGSKINTGTLALAITNLNNKIRRHGLSASQIHFSRDQNTGENLPIQDSKLREVREERKEASPRHQAVTTPCPQPGQLVYLREEGTKHTGRSPLMVTGCEKGKVSASRVLHTAHSGGPPPRITSQQVRIDPKFLYIPPHRRAPLSCYTGPLSSTSRHTKAPTSSWRHSRPYQDDDDDTVVTSWASRAPPRHQIVRQPGAGGPPAAVEEGGDEAEEREDAAGEGGDKVEEEAEEGAVVAEDEVEMAEAGGGEVVEEEGGDDEQDEADDNVVVYQPLPAAQQAPKKRRRPPREVWIVNQDAARAEVAAQAPPAQQDLGRPVRIRREPDHYGIEKGRGPDTCPELVLTLSAPPSRDITPLSTPVPSPDSTLELESKPAHAHGLPTWLTEQGILPKGAPGDVLEAHRHWSIGGGETEQGRLYPMLDWTPRTERQPPSC